ncbi:MAG: beta-ketoacyl-ACP synthase II [Anaerolineales bacterium]
MPDKVVITGMGTINPIGLTIDETWQNAINGVSGVGPITLFDAEEYLVSHACEVKDFTPEKYMDARDARRRDRFQQFASAASQEAIQQSGLEVSEEESGKVGVIVSSAIGGLQAVADNLRVLMDKGPRRISPFAIPMLMSNGAAGLIAIDNGFRGPSFSVASACASGADGVGMAWLLIRAGIIDVAISGASEAIITEVALSAFDRMRALSRRDGEDRDTPQPFDLNRDGLVMGEGAAILVLERESRAIDRGADILAELAGYGGTADAFHITAPSEDGIGGSKAIQAALEAAEANPEDIGYISAHGTATKLNDLSETRAIKKVFGDLAYEIPISSTKSMTGHMMGTTGALEAIFCVQAIRENILPPTINYETPDPECDLDFIPNAAREKDITMAVSNAFGFGGHNAVLVVKEYS